MSVRDEKVQIVEEITEKFRTSISTIVTDYRGLNVAEVTELRKKLRDAGIEYRVLKNTMTRRATAAVGLTELDATLAGPTAIAFCASDVVAPAKILNDFAKTHKSLEIKGGVVEGKVISVEQVQDLASLPSREGLVSMFLSVLQAPMRNLAYAVKQIADQQEQA
jgi:large subunit ribosomal protein L10